MAVVENDAPFLCRASRPTNYIAIMDEYVQL